MNAFVIANSEGRITKYGEIPDTMLDDFWDPDGEPLWLDQPIANPFEWYVDENGTIQPRPELAGDWTGIPAGTRVHVEHSDLGTLIETTLTETTDVAFSMSTPGRYVVKFEPPFPWYDRQEVHNV